MFALFRNAIDRVKALFIAEAALDFEAQLIARNADRKAELLRQASEYEREGLSGVAEEMRQLADRICLREPLACVLPSVDHWLGHQTPSIRPVLPNRPKVRPLAPVPDAKKRK